MKIERIKKSFTSHGISCWLVLSINGCCLERPAVRISFTDDEFPGEVRYIIFGNFAAAYRYCKDHGLLDSSRRVR